jgi:hypothetical protein
MQSGVAIAIFEQLLHGPAGLLLVTSISPQCDDDRPDGQNANAQKEKG